MTKSIRVSEPFHTYLRTHNRDGETMEETLCRLIGESSPELNGSPVRPSVAD
ncbi:hypothetical protein [Haloferax sp. YSSS75]|uniref:hypothetical protein n=1 Tax=Haloferax sp. YSSS75 TaxID=3388564 RepID=UPI00398CF42B